MVRGMRITGLAAAAAANGADVLSDAALVIVIGMIVVFAALIVLTAIFWIFGKAMHKNPTNSADIKEVKQFVPQAATPVKQPEGISSEVIAVIAAAVAAMAPEGTQYTVRSVRKVRNTRGDRPVWAAAGIAENTRPF